MNVKCVTYVFPQHTLVVKDESLPYQADSDIYYQDLQAWIDLPRGKATVYLNTVDPDNKVHQLVGMRKFGEENKSFGHGRPSSFARCQGYIKENGECFHVSYFAVDNVTYCLLGSKHVHICILCDFTTLSLSSQLEQITRDGGARVTYAVEMSTFFFGTYHTDALGQDCVESGVTLVAESIDPQRPHVVQYKQRDLRFFAITHPDASRLWVYGTMDDSRAFFDKHNLSMVTCLFDVPHDHLARTQIKYKTLCNCEGWVSYYLDESDQVVYVEKHKTKEYTILRSVRELWKADASIDKFHTRFSNYHIFLTQAELHNFFRFYCFLRKHHNPLTTKTAISELYRLACLNALNAQTWTPHAQTHPKLLVMLVNSTPDVGSQLMYQLRGIHVSSVFLDERMMHGDRKRLLTTIRSYLQDDDVQVIITGCQNLTQKKRREVLSQCTGHEKILILSTPSTSHIQSYEQPTHAEFANLASLVPLTLMSCESHDTYTALSTSLQCLGMDIAHVESVQVQEDWKMCGYIALTVNPMDIKSHIEKLCSKLHPLPFEEKHIVKNPHVTLVHMERFIIDKEAWKLACILSRHVGETVTVVCHEIQWNERICAIRCSILHDTIRSDNTYVHITWAKKKGVESYESNTMSQGEHTSMPLFDLHLSGTVERFCCC